MKNCPVCGSLSFKSDKVIWDKLAEDWNLSEYERSYIDKQQGFHCTVCRNNLRTMLMAKTIMDIYEYSGYFNDFIKKWRYGKLKILEINAVGELHNSLKNMRHCIFAEYPEHDMNTLSAFENDSFDLVVHSDTLEHVPTPVNALKTCRRVLKPGGFCVFTIPVIVGRMTRSREGLASSYHGSADALKDDFTVKTEFGADMWTYVMEAGYSACNITQIEYPAALAISAKK